MTNMSDEEMTPEEFDARVAAGEPAELHVALNRARDLYRVVTVCGTGVSAGRAYAPIMRHVPPVVPAPAA